MKETHLFYLPGLPSAAEMPAEEAGHAIRVLRMREGDTLWATDGRGGLYACRIVSATPKRCALEVERSRQAERPWRGGIHLAVAATKNMDRMEWLAEKATEIGLDSLTFLDCRNSERHVVKTERIEKIVVGALKQSHKAWLPRVAGPVALPQFLAQPFAGEKFIAHCQAGAPSADAFDDLLRSTGADSLLAGAVSPEGDTLVLIGPEGDFTPEEVAQARAAGFQPVSLGPCRLRTETAALVAVHLMNLAKSGTPAAPHTHPAAPCSNS